MGSGSIVAVRKMGAACSVCAIRIRHGWREERCNRCLESSALGVQVAVLRKRHLDWNMVINLENGGSGVERGFAVSVAL
jgi:hypothetical protein